jgi:hypothetical protein
MIKPIYPATRYSRTRGAWRQERATHPKRFKRDGYGEAGEEVVTSFSAAVYQISAQVDKFYYNSVIFSMMN